jgi:hypothetical protein
VRAAARVAAAALAVLAATPVAAQPDTTAAPVREPAPEAAPADSLQVADSARVALPRPSVAPPGPAAGRPVTPVPALTAALGAETLLADAPGAWAWPTGAPGRAVGVAFDGLGPDAPALTLDGRPLDDPFTGAPRYDLLPVFAVGPLRLQDGRRGRTFGVGAAVRPFRLGVPVTELRYGAGQEGVQQISATHAQTRRPPALLRGGSEDARLTLTGHVASRRATGTLSGLSGGAVTGAALRHTDILGRLLLTRPGAAVEAGVLHADRTVGARLGVVAAAGADPFDGLFNEDAALALDPSASRRTLRTEAWALVRLPLAAEPLDVGVSYALQRLVYVPGSRDTLRAHGRRLAGHVRQPVRLGGHRLALRAAVVWDDDPGGGADPFGDTGGRLALHGAVSDSVQIGPLALAVEAGLNALSGALWPSAALRAEAGPAFAAVRLGGRAPSRLETAGLAGGVGALADVPVERTLSGETGLQVAAGDWRAGARAFGHVRDGARDVVAVGDSAFAFAVLGTVREAGAAVTAGWREGARRGLYVRAEGTARTLLGADDDLRQRLDAALPRAWGALRLGLRAEDVGDGVLDLDLAAVARGWTAFRSRRVEPTTGLLALPEPGTSLGIDIPAQATLGLEATATFSARASLFLRYDDALAERVTPGTLATQGEPLPGHILRFGVFWALVN